MGRPASLVVTLWKSVFYCYFNEILKAYGWLANHIGRQRSDNMRADLIISKKRLTGKSSGI